MKLITDNAFTKAWKISCPTCRIDQPNSILRFRKQCHECEIKVVADKKYTEEDIRKAFKYGIEMEAGIKSFDYKNYPDGFSQFINSLNKQDNEN
jgi:hypothetical protein